MIKIEVLEEIKNVVASLNKIDDYKEVLVEEQSKYDLMLSDLYHFIELNKFDSKSSYRIVKELKQVLSERRKVKVNLSVLRSFDMQRQKIINKDNRNIMMSTVSKCNKELLNDNGYNIYSKEELDNIIIQTNFKIKNFYLDGGDNNKWLIYVLEK